MEFSINKIIANSSSVQWGFYDPEAKPLFDVSSGDIVEVHTEPGMREVDSEMREIVSPELIDIVENGERKLGGHILNGPIGIREALAGDVLEVKMLEILPRYNWGFNRFRPLSGGLPEDFPYERRIIIEIDKEKNVCDWETGVPIPLSPFFGNMGVAPPLNLGKVTSGVPGPWGGNMDNKEFTEGTSVFFPVFVDGAQFSIGDGHGCQGDGESCLSALECGLIGKIQFFLHRNTALDVPMAESSSDYIFMGFDPILDNAIKSVIREAIKFLVERFEMKKDDAYTLCSLSLDLRVTQIVNGTKGVHGLLSKSLFEDMN